MYRCVFKKMVIIGELMWCKWNKSRADMLLLLFCYNCTTHSVLSLTYQSENVET